ncbi:MAG TPA: primosomal protein N' [Solirubrobacteraceae bacterium]|jgi:primosomal protein N' (replication factor Y)|nr:primosomal protein N' [Solirubrobacteraceae bacterium]
MSCIAQVEPMTTARALRGPFDYRLPEELRDGAVGVGSMLVVPFGRREVLGVVVGLADTSEVASEKLLAPLRALELGVPAEMVALAEWIATEYCSTLARALGLVLPPGATRRLSGRKRRAVKRSEHVPVGARSPEPPVPNDEQQAVLTLLQGALSERAAHARLLHGVTGSGKTEIYLRAAEIALAQGCGAIVLVPEIALTPQIVGRFIERFGETVAVMHSQLRPGERYAEWRRLREGQARICVGPRSAVFAPIDDLGLIVVDEEHDASYKHEGDPRYDARDVAAERARRSDAVLLLGSATPRAESARRMACSTLARRVDGRPLPSVQVLDMRGDRSQIAQQGLHPTTAQALAQVRGSRTKAIVLLNRRGWSNFLSCRSCGRVWGCPHCDVALVLHRAGGFLACHHCGHREPAPQRCDACSSTSVARHGAGTERLQHELTAVLDDDGAFPIFRLDADVVSGPGGRTTTADAPGGSSIAEQARDGDGGAGALLRRFEAAECGVLIGTQMVAKGHDFPDVALGVVLDADATLRFPDFRAEERTFALIAQLAGRVGRGGEGRVLVQTIAPDARAIVYAARHDSDGFLAGELQRRQALSYPPFSHLIRVVCSAERSASARTAAAAVRESFTANMSQDEAVSGEGATVLGPASLFRLRGREREVLVIKAGERRGAVRAVGAAVQEVSAGREHQGVNFSVDVDPQ